MPGFLLLLAIGLLVYSSLLVWFTYARLTRPDRRTYSWAVARSLPGEPGEMTPALSFERFEFSSRGLKLIAWDIAGLNPAGPVFVLTHGWSESKVVMLSRVQEFAPFASRLIAWDLPGHGESQGRCSLGLEEAADLKLLLESVWSESVRPRVVLYGSSLGAGISIAVAAESPGKIAAVIAEAAYRLAGTPAANVMQARGLGWKLNLPMAMWILAKTHGKNWDGFDRAKLASRLQCPLLVLWGDADIVCPREDAQEVAQAGKGRFVTVEGASHNNIWLNEASRGKASGAVGEFVRFAL